MICATAALTAYLLAGGTSGLGYTPYSGGLGASLEHYTARTVFSADITGMWSEKLLWGLVRTGEATLRGALRLPRSIVVGAGVDLRRVEFRDYPGSLRMYAQPLLSVGYDDGDLRCVGSYEFSGGDTWYRSTRARAAMRYRWPSGLTLLWSASSVAYDWGSERNRGATFDIGIGYSRRIGE